MPVIRRELNIDRVDPDAFRVYDGVGKHPYFGDPGYPDRATAERAWRKVRRLVWSNTRRMSVPGAAEAYDGLSFESFSAVWNQLSHVPAAFDMARVELAIAADLAAVQTFREDDPAGATDIADFLDQLLADLDVVRAAAAERVASGYEGVGILTAPSAFSYGGRDHRQSSRTA